MVPPSGRTLSGGIDPAAFSNLNDFWCCQKYRRRGSLTILATALVDTGSRMDDVIYEEFKGTGNMELHLSRELAERRIFQQLILKIKYAKEELLMTPEQLEETWKLRNNMSGDSLEYTDQFIKMLKRTQNNQQLFEVFHDVSFGKQIKRNPKR